MRRGSPGGIRRPEVRGCNTTELPLAQSFRNQSNLRGVFTVFGEYGLIVAALFVAYLYPSWWLYPLLVLLIGTRQYALAEVMTHEAVHSNLCADRRLNELLGRVTSWPFFYVFSGYRRYHLEHHRVPLTDDDNNILEQYEAWGLPSTDEPLGRTRALWLFLGRSLCGIMAIHHVRTICSNVYYDRDLPENYLMMGFWLCVVALFWHFGLLVELLIYWIIPQLLVIGTLDFWSETSDHYRVRGADTRSDLNPFLNRFISYNIGYHALHHRFPGIPWFQLPAAYRALRGELREEMSRGFTQTWRQITSGCD